MPLTRSRERHTCGPVVRSTAVQFPTSVPTQIFVYSNFSQSKSFVYFSISQCLISKIELLFMIEEFVHVRCIEDGEEVLEKDPRTKNCCSGRYVSKTILSCEECERRMPGIP
jgi:hypothetical protein